jgi:dolichol-phosphate mannosyltransferase
MCRNDGQTLVNLETNHLVRNALVFPTYREFESVKTLLSAIAPQLGISDAVIICDDTGAEFEKIISSDISKIFEGSECSLIFSFSDSKSGRGAAVFRGMKIATQTFPNLNYVLEADSDGSHQPQDINRVLRSNDADFTIGSRYLPESKIIGWPFSRRFFSSLLNKLIPKILNLDCTDATNGLRRYSLKSVNELLQRGISNTGFIYLSEQAVHLTNAGYLITEAPITFVNRTHGESSVGMKEIRDSVIGIFSIYRKVKKQL